MTLYPEDIERYGQPADELTEADPVEVAAEAIRLHSNGSAHGSASVAVAALRAAGLVGGRSADPECPESCTADGRHCKCESDHCCWCGADRPSATDLAASINVLRAWAEENRYLDTLAGHIENVLLAVGGRSAAPTRDELGQRLTDAQQHNETLRAERDEARAVVVEARDILDALIEWFGAPNWAGPDLPVELGRRIATLLGPRSAVNRVRAPWSPTPSLPAGVGIVRLSDCETFTLGERTHDDDTGQDGYEVNQGGFISDEAITSGRWALAVTDAVVALLSRPAGPPDAERTLDEARSLMRTARSLDPTKPVSNELLGQVFGDLIDLLAPDGATAEPKEPGDD